MLILQKENIILDLNKMQNWIHEYRLDISMQINGRIKRTGFYLFKRYKEPSIDWVTSCCGMYDEIFFTINKELQGK